jgi:hypothetical protein
VTTLLALVGRIADGDRDAMMALCARLGPAVCARAADDPAVVLATFVEMWWLAMHSPPCVPGRSWQRRHPTSRNRPESALPIHRGA